MCKKILINDLYPPVIVLWMSMKVSRYTKRHYNSNHTDNFGMFHHNHYTRYRSYCCQLGSMLCKLIHCICRKDTSKHNCSCRCIAGHTKCSCSQFYRHFKTNFSPNFLSPKKYKAKLMHV